jgi:hypothetical protein
VWSPNKKEVISVLLEEQIKSWRELREGRKPQIRRCIDEGWVGDTGKGISDGRNSMAKVQTRVQPNWVRPRVNDI